MRFTFADLLSESLIRKLVATINHLAIGPVGGFDRFDALHGAVETLATETGFGKSAHKLGHV